METSLNFSHKYFGKKIKFTGGYWRIYGLCSASQGGLQTVQNVSTGAAHARPFASPEGMRSPSH